MKTSELRAQLASERELRQAAERKLAAYVARASVNNTALAKSNLRLQEQVARLRGETDLLQHEAGCLRAAAAARQREAAKLLVKLQQRLQKALVEVKELKKQLDGKQGIITYLEGRLAESQGHSSQMVGGYGCRHAEPAASTAAGSSSAASGGSPLAVQPDSPVQASPWQASTEQEESEASGCSQAGSSCQAAAAAHEETEEGQHQDGVAELEIDVGCQGSTSISQACQREVVEQMEEQGQMKVAMGGVSTHAATATAAAGKGLDAEPATEPAAEGLGAAAAAAATECTPPPRRQMQQQSAGTQDSQEQGGTVLRTSLRSRGGSRVTYAEPSLRSKLRQGDPHTFAFGAEDLEAAAGAGAGASGAAGGSSRHPRARTKPRPRFAAQPAGGGSGGSTLPPVAD